MNIAEIILLIVAISAAIAAYVCYRRTQKYKAGRNNITTDYHYLDIELHARKQMDNDTKPWYEIRYISRPINNIYSKQVLAVVRRTHSGQYWSASVIKVFTDKDESYNQRCAEELLEKLTEK